MSSAKAIIMSHPFFQGMNTQHLELVANSGVELIFEPEEVLFREGRPANRFYLIQHGRVAVESRVHETELKQLCLVSDGEVLGWSWLFPPFCWHFDARAVERTEAVALDGARLLVACELNHDLGYELMKRVAGILIQRLQGARTQLADASGVHQTRLPACRGLTAAGS